MADVQPYVLRYWESEFPALVAEKGSATPRFYSESDLDVIRRIKQLLYDEGYTIAGAKKRLEGEIRGGKLPGLDVAPLPPAAPEEGEESQPLLVPVPPPLPPSQTPKQRKPRGRSGAQRPQEEPGLLLEEVFENAEAVEETASTAPREPRAEPIDLPPERVIQRPDPRVATTLAQLKEILDLLSREP
jgi:DNA-binding transcriptional MerR regulator